MTIGAILRRGFGQTRLVAIGVLSLALLRFPYGVLVDFLVKRNGDLLSLQGFLVAGFVHLASLFFTPLIIAGILRKLINRTAQQPAGEAVTVNVALRIYPRMLALYTLYLMTAFALMLPILFLFGFLGIRLAFEGAGANQVETQISQLVSVAEGFFGW